MAKVPISLKTPQVAGDSPGEQDRFILQTKLKNPRREVMGEQPATHSEAG